MKKAKPQPRGEHRERFLRAIHLAVAEYAHKEWLESVRAGKKRTRA
jgi:hypothetical protein